MAGTHRGGDEGVGVAYPEGLLADGEEVVLHEHPHWKALVVPVLVLLVVAAAVGYLGALVAGTGWSSPGLVALAVLGAAAVLWWTVVPVLRWRTTHFVLTTARVLVREGVLSRSGIDIPLARTAGVQFRRTPLERVLGCGTLVIETASDEPLEFDDVPHVERVHSRLNQQISAAEDPYRTVDRLPREPW